MTFPVTDADNARQQLLTGAELSAALGAIKTATDAVTSAVNTLAPYLDGVETGLGNVVSAVNAPSGTQPLPTGAATEATIAALSAKLPASVGAKAQSGSLSVVLATSSDVATDSKLALTTPADDAFAITPSDSADLATFPKALLVTAAGTLAIRGTGGVTVSLGSVTAGALLPIRARRVMATGTTATVVGLI